MNAAAIDARAVSPGQVWSWLGEVADPEIPVISIVDLGIVRDVRIDDDGACTVTITLVIYTGSRWRQAAHSSVH